MFLGIDIGTSAVKAVLVAEDFVVAQSSAPLTVSRPHLLWSEQEPGAWWHAVQTAVLALDPALRSGVQGIGLAGQMHGAAVLDASDGRCGLPFSGMTAARSGRSGWPVAARARCFGPASSPPRSTAR